MGLTVYFSDTFHIVLKNDVSSESVLGILQNIIASKSDVEKDKILQNSLAPLINFPETTKNWDDKTLYSNDEKLSNQILFMIKLMTKVTKRRCISLQTPLSLIKEKCILDNTTGTQICWII